MEFSFSMKFRLSSANKKAETTNKKRDGAEGLPRNFLVNELYIHVVSHARRHDLGERFEIGEVEPLRACDFCAGDFDGVAAEGFVEGEADGLDGDVGGAGALEEGSVRSYIISLHDRCRR